MSRRKQASKKEIVGDPICRSVLVARLTNYVMVDGKKIVAMRAVYKAMYLALMENEEIRSTAGRTGRILVKVFALDYTQIESSKVTKMVALLEASIESIISPVEVKSRRVGGANYQVPVEVRPDRRLTLALRWLVQAANKRNEKTLIERLGLEIYQSTKGLGGAIKKKEETLRMAKANRVFSHFRV